MTTGCRRAGHRARRYAGACSGRHGDRPYDVGTACGASACAARDRPISDFEFQNKICQFGFYRVEYMIETGILDFLEITGFLLSQE